MSEEIVFQWLGTAGFRIWYDNKVLLIDPYLTRNERATPRQTLKAEDMAAADYIFLSHGHFDHLFDIPAIIKASGATVHCSQVASKTLSRLGVPSAKISVVSWGESLDFGTFKVGIAPSRHIRFDAKLILGTMPGILRDRRAMKQFERMPAGTVLTTAFDFDGLVVVHLGSMGQTPQQAAALELGAPDILLPPLQGHTNICRRAAAVTAAMRPRAVIPQHFDDFFPPISRTIDIEPFRSMVAELLPECAYYEPEMNRKFTPAEVFGGR